MPEHYRWQVQHQLMVAKAEVADVYVFDGESGLLLPVVPEPSSWTRIREGWGMFAEFVAKRSAPPLIKGDVRERSDPEWISAAEAYLEAKQSADAMSKILDEKKAGLLALADHTSVTGSGVTVTRFWKNGVVDYKKIPEINAVDLEQYRGPVREEVRVTIAR